MLDTLGYDIELQEKYLADSKSGPCPCFKGVIHFYWREHHSRMIFTIWWMASFAVRHGTQWADMSIQLCRMDTSCMAGQMTSVCWLLVAMGKKKGILWNTRDNTLYEITVPNKSHFLDTVTNAITKGVIKKYNKPSDKNIQLNELGIKLSKLAKKEGWLNGLFCCNWYWDKLE